MPPVSRGSSTIDNQQKDTSIKKIEDKLFCFQSEKWNEIIQKSFTLNQVFRQKDSEFVSILNSIRFGNFTNIISQTLAPCVNREFQCDDGILPTRICTHRKEVDDLNLRELSFLPGAEYFLNQILFIIVLIVAFIK